MSTHVTPQWDKFEATIESWHIQRNPPTVHHVLYHVVCSHREPRLGRQWQRNGHEKGGERYTGNMRIAYCSGLFFISKKVGKETHASVFFFFFFASILALVLKMTHMSRDLDCRSLRQQLSSPTIYFSRQPNDTWTTLENCTRPSFSYFSRGGGVMGSTRTQKQEKRKKRERKTREFRSWLTALIPFTNHPSWLMIDVRKIHWENRWSLLHLEQYNVERKVRKFHAVLSREIHQSIT